MNAGAAAGARRFGDSKLAVRGVQQRPRAYVLWSRIGSRFSGGWYDSGADLHQRRRGASLLGFPPLREDDRDAAAAEKDLLREALDVEDPATDAFGRARRRVFEDVAAGTRRPPPLTLDLALDRGALAAGVAGVDACRAARSAARASPRRPSGSARRPRGTTNSSPGPSTTSRSRSWIVSRPSSDEEEVVGLVVLVPDELALGLDDQELVVVQVADDRGLVGAGEQRELLGEVDLVVHGSKLQQRPLAVRLDSPRRVKRDVGEHAADARDGGAGRRVEEEVVARRDHDEETRTG